MNKSQRIRVDLTGNTRNIKFNLNQDTDFLEILSLKIDQRKAWQFFNADYGVVVGRVIANGGVGVPNAKVSIFIPITDGDKLRSEIRALYPYEKADDKNPDGRRYNLLPRVAKQDPETGAFKPRQPFGSLPVKEELLTNETWLEIYEKYYKYSTVTNDAGDYMMFGVPTGVQTVHMSVDITDIGRYSMNPADMVTQLGFPEQLFTSNLAEIKPSNDLDDLPHIETQEIAVDVVPYWGDTENYQIGITRQDFRIRAQLVSNFVVFGSYFTMGTDAVNGDPDIDRRDRGFYRLSRTYVNNVDSRVNRVGAIDVKIYSYIPSINIEDVDDDITNSGTTINPQTDILLVDSSSYYEFQDSNNGQFLVSVPCNRVKVITNEFGQTVQVADSNETGVFTKFYGFMTFEHEDLQITKTYGDSWKRPNSPNNARLRFKIPQQVHGPRDVENWGTIGNERNIKETNIWRKRYFTFESGKFYGVSQFFPTRFTDQDRDEPDTDGTANVFLQDGGVNLGSNDLIEMIGPFKGGGPNLITQGSYDVNNILSGGTSGGTITASTFINDFPFNYTATTDGSGNIDSNGDMTYFFGGQWLNFSMYFPQINWTFAFTSGNDRDQNTADMWFRDYRDGKEGKKGEWFTVGGSKTQQLFGGFIDTSFFARSDSLQTDFVEAPIEDLVQINNYSPDLDGTRFSGFTNTRGSKGFFLNKIDISGYTNPSYLLSGTYKYRTPNYGGDFSRGTAPDYTPQVTRFKTDAFDQRYGVDYSEPNPFFFKGMYNADCVALLFDLNFI